MKKTFENEYSEFWIQDGILYFVYKPNTVIDLQTAHKIVADRVKFQKEKSYPIFCDSRGVQESEKAARDFLAKEGSLLAEVVVVLANLSVSKGMALFYVRTSKPLVLTKTFTNKYEALKFLENYTPD